MPANQPRNDPSLPPVLIVDGQSFPRRTLKRVLRAIGANGLQEAATADAALAVLAGARRQDWLVMCDIAIAAEAEMAFARALAERAPGARLVVLGACKAEELGAFARLAETRSLTPFALMRKPPSAEELRALLLRASGAQTALRLPEPTRGPRKLTPEEVTECLRAEWMHAFFQPKIELGTGRTVSCEALARILHPQMGELRPAQFLGAIDAADGHRTLTACMLEHAARMVRTLRAESAALSVSINLSPDCLSEPGDGAKLAAYAGALGLRPAELVLEVSQAALVGVGPAVVDNLARLRALGFALSVDDFGAATVSRDELFGIPFSEIKLDRALVARLAGTPDAATEALVAAAKRDGMVICAEGVETPEELATVRGLHCDFAQGYLFARPMSATDMQAWARKAWVLRPMAGGERHSALAR